MLSRTDANIGFNWGNGSPGAGVGTNSWSVRWSGEIEARYSQTYTFVTYSDDGIRVWVNGVQQLISTTTATRQRGPGPLRRRAVGHRHRL
ncbi:MAG: hypothetical protein HC927_11340, partial [Deltaproteobacteria bacterium]|nr:hypothetical protein [Deltaproteobacteria bacterium]